jgi:cell division protein FtsW
MSHPAAKLSILIILLGLIGLLAVYSASIAENLGNPNTKLDEYRLVKQQATWLIVGLITFFVVSRIPITLIKKFIPLALIISILLMLLVFVPGIGQKLQGATRWINLGFFHLQPSEIFKISLILYLATWLEKKRSLRSFLLIICLSIGLIMLQSDLGSAVVLGTGAFLIYYLSGAKAKELFGISSIVLFLGFILILISPYRLRRVSTFLDPTTDPLGASYHIRQVLLSLGSGGWFGVGLGRSLQKHAFLPEASTDSIFAVICEEMGFFGGVILIGLFIGLIMLGYKISLSAKDQFTKLVAAGITSLIAVQIFVNLSAMVALVPLTGIPLPLISYGGSSLITTLFGLGILASAAKNK